MGSSVNKNSTCHALISNNNFNRTKLVITSWWSSALTRLNDKQIKCLPWNKIRNWNEIFKFFFCFFSNLLSAFSRFVYLLNAFNMNNRNLILLRFSLACSKFPICFIFSHLCRIVNKVLRAKCSWKNLTRINTCCLMRIDFFMLKFVVSRTYVTIIRILARSLTRK